jgi:hypothetical protein
VSRLPAKRISCGPCPAWDDVKRCTKCGEEKPLADFSRSRSRKDGCYPQCKACVRRWHHENAQHLAKYHRRWQQANRDKTRSQAAATGRSEPKTPSTGSEGAPRPAVTGSGSERDSLTRRHGSTTLKRTLPGRERRCSSVSARAAWASAWHTSCERGGRCRVSPRRLQTASEKMGSTSATISSRDTYSLPLPIATDTSIERRADAAVATTSPLRPAASARWIPLAYAMRSAAIPLVMWYCARCVVLRRRAP